MNQSKDFRQIKRLSKWSVTVTALVLLASIFGSTTKSTQAALSTDMHLPIMFRSVVPNVPQSRFGVQMYFDTGETGNNPYYDAIVDSGVSWIRCNIPWNRVEQTDVDPNGYDWEWADYAVGAARNGRYNQVITLEHAPSWFSAGDGLPNPGQSVDDIAEFMAAVAERYDGDGFRDGYGTPIVNHFELYNEPDHKARWGNDGAAYAQMLSVVAPAIKAANPNAKVLLGGVAMDWFTDLQPGDAFLQPGDFVRSFVPDVFAAGGGQHIDMVAIHQYPAFREQWSPGGQGTGLIEKVQATRQIMGQYGLNKPIMITETGANSNSVENGPQGTEESQSRYLVELFTQSYAADVEALMWFTMYDGDDIHNGGIATGLVKQPTTTGAAPYRKQALTAYSTIVSMLGSAQFQRTLPVGETGNALMEAHQFVNTATGKTLYVAWMNPIDSTEQVALSVPGAQATLTDIYGNVTGSVADAADGVADGRVTVSVSGQPVYIQIN